MNILGSTVEIRISSKESGGQYYVFEITLPPGEGVPPHVHSLENEVICVTEGELEISIDGEKMVSKRNVVRNFPVGTPHGFKNTSTEECRAVIFVSPGASFERFFEELSRISLGADTDMNAVVAVTERYGMKFVEK